MEKGGCRVEDLNKDINGNEVEETKDNIRRDHEEQFDKYGSEGMPSFLLVYFL